MKSKNKFNNQNIKHKFKFFVIFFIIVSSVYLLYFNDKIFVESIIKNSLNSEIDNKSNIIENFDVSKYVDVCKNRRTRFYNHQPSPLTEKIITTGSNCEYECDNTANCQFFTRIDNADGVIDESKCYLYISPLDSTTNLDTNTNMSTKINCNSTILPGVDYAYNGTGYINKKYFENNKSKFGYIDAYFDSANQLVSELKAANININESRSAQQINDAGIAKSNLVNNWIDRFAALLGYNRANLVTENSRTSMFTEDITGDENYKKLRKLGDITKETPLLESKLADSKNSGYVDNLFYTILAFIMIITIILLILYRLNDNVIISDRFMIIYFIVIVSIFLFIRFMLNK